MPPESDIFTWKSLSNWQHAIASLIPKKLRKSLIDAIHERREDFKHHDDATCLETLYSEFGDYQDLTDRFVDMFSHRFQFIRMFHCCRPADTGSYYACGIRTLDFDYANVQFKDLVRETPALSKVTDAHLQMAFDEMRSSYHRNGYVYFGLDDRFLANHCRHYLNKGSEYAQSLAAIIDRECEVDVMARLENLGSPAIFEAKIPVEDFGASNIRELAPSALSAWAFDVAHRTGTTFEIDFGIGLTNNLLPKYIIRHYDPDSIG